MKCEEVKFYYDILLKKKLSIKVKRIFDIALASFMLIILAVPMIIISIMIKIDSQGPVFYRQERITAYGKKFRIHKFRTMVNNADKIGTSVTIDEDSRITIVGSKLRSLRIDEIPQLLDVLSGNMSFVGTRPEATKYVEKYTKEMRATAISFFHKKSFNIMIATVIAAISNVIMNYVFIMKCGYIAAGYTTLASNLILTALHYINSRKIEKEKVYDFKFCLLSVLVVTISCLLCNLIYKFTWVRYGVILIIILIVFKFRNKLINSITAMKV